MLRNLRLTLIFLSLSVALQAQTPYTASVQVRTGEYWWGISASDQFVNPFDGAFSADHNTFRSPFSLPVVISSEGRYAACQSPADFAFDGKTITVTSSVEKVEFAQSGHSLREAYLVCLQKFFPPSGNAPSNDLFASPVYDLGELSGEFDAQKIESTADRILSEGLPAGTLLVPRGWESLSNNFSFDVQLFPTATTFIERLHAKGFKIMLTVTPYIAASGRDYVKYRNESRLLSNAEGKPLVFETDYGYSAALSPSPQLARSINDQLTVLRTTTAVDGYLFDCAAVTARLSADAAANYRSFWRSAAEGFDMMLFAPDPVSPSDEAVSLVALPDKINVGSLERIMHTVTNAGLLGYRYIALGGTENLTSQSVDMVKLTLTLMATMPVAVIPYPLDNVKDRRWLVDIVKWRTTIARAVATAASESASTGEPLVRTMEYQFPDSGFANCTDQYIIGGKWLVAPVLQQGGKRMVRLPRGTWNDSDGKRIKGPRVVNVTVTDPVAAIFELQK